MKNIRVFAVIGLIASLALVSLSTSVRLTMASNPPVVVKVVNMNGWFFIDDQNDSLATAAGTLVVGPATPPIGTGSARLALGGASDGQAIARPVVAAIPLSQITKLEYDTYRSSVDAGNNLAIAFQFPIDFSTSDLLTGFQGRLVFEPYQGIGGNVPQNTWQHWNALSGRWWASKTSASGSNGLCPQSSPCTWLQVLANWPTATIRPDAVGLVFKAGSNWAGFDGNVDNFTLGLNNVDTTYDFEGTLQCTTDCYVDPSGNDLNGGTGIGDEKKTIQAAVNQVNAGGTVHVAAGTYHEDISIAKTLTLQGAGPSTSTLSGVLGGGSATVQVGAGGVIIDGFRITRDGNAVATWNDSLNTAGVAIQGLTNNAEIRNNSFDGNRTAIDINNSNGNSIHNNVIDFNRTGLIFRNQTDNTVFEENFVTNNWTVGVLFLDASGGTDSPIQSAANSRFNNNDITGNWYGQVVDRQAGGSLPAPGTSNLKDFTGNWWGTINPVVTTSNSTEPGYAAQIPVAYGGTATAPGGQPDIAGPASANIVYQPLLCSGTDTDMETTPGRGTYGFQGVAPCTQQPAISVNVTSPLTYGTSETLTISGGAGTGTVTYFLDSGGCSLAGDQLTANAGSGVCKVHASKGGDDTHYAATSAQASVTLSKAATNTAIVSSKNPSAYGDSVSFTATVTKVNPAPAAITGTVQFFINNVAFGPAVAVSGAGTATSGSTSTLAVGGHTVKAVYSGDGNYGTSNNSLTQVVGSSIKMTGGGGITNNTRHFGFDVKPAKDGTSASGFKGHLDFEDKTVGYKFKSTTTTTEYATDSHHGTIKGTGNVGNVTGCAFTATVEDNAAKGTGYDKFGITVTGPTGCSYSVALGLLSSGDIKIHYDKDVFTTNTLNGEGTFMSPANAFDIDMVTSDLDGSVRFWLGTDVNAPSYLMSDQITSFKTGGTITINGTCDTAFSGSACSTFQLEWETGPKKLHIRLYNAANKQIYDSKSTALTSGAITFTAAP